MAFEAVALLEQIPPGQELARAYNTLAAVLGVVGDDQFLGWAQRAIELAERIGCLDDRELAERAGDDLGVARAYLNLAAILAARREWVLAGQYIGAGLAYCHDRGLESSWGWLAALAAEAALAQGRADEAAGTAATILESAAGEMSHARVRALAVLARLRARGGDTGYVPLLDQAADGAKASPFAEATMIIATARAELAWLEGASASKIGAAIRSSGEATGVELRWYAGEREAWLHRAGLDCGDPAGLPEPYRLEITGDIDGAAAWWQERGCTYDAALVLAGSGDRAALRRALDLLDGLGVHRAASVVARRLRALGEPDVPRVPRPATAANPAGLTGRQMEVLAYLASGPSNSAIAARLTLSGRTVDNNVSAIFRKLRVQTRDQARAQAVRLGISLPEPDA